jgi:hypothetical protein
VCTQLLRLNKQIHEEVSNELYSQGSFEIAVLSNQPALFVNIPSTSPSASILMCQGRFTTTPETIQMALQTTPANRHHLQDYQMQLMLLEQQNRRRLLLARRGNFPLPPPAPITPRRRTANYAFINCSLDGWIPKNVSVDNVQRMKSLLINITFLAITKDHVLSSHEQLYELCDSLHKLAGLLATIPPENMKKFEVTITISLENESNIKTDEIVKISKILLQPLQRLRGIQSARVVSIGVRDHQPVQFQGPMISAGSNSIHEIQKSIHYRSDAPEEYHHGLRSVVDRWQADVSSPGPAQESREYKAAYTLAEMISKMSTHEVLLDSEITQLVEIISKARAAREQEDFSGLRNAYEMVLELIEAHKNMQEDFVDYTAGLTRETHTFFTEDES